MKIVEPGTAVTMLHLTPAPVLPCDLRSRDKRGGRDTRPSVLMTQVNADTWSHNGHNLAHMFHFYNNLQCSIEVKSVMIINIHWQQSRPTMTRLYSRIHHFIYYRPATALAHLRTGDGRHADRLHLRVDHQLACQKLCQKLLTKTC